MNRTLRTLAVGVLLVVLTACTSGAPTGATLPPLTTAAVTTGSTAPSAGAAGPTTDPTTEAPRSESSSSVVVETPVDVTVPPEASALPLPTAQVDIPADNPQEEADRAAIKAVWRQFWDLYRDGYEIAEADLSIAASQISIDPIYSQLVSGSNQGRRLNLTTYGDITLHSFWYNPVDGRMSAVIGDCIDFSQFGEIDPTTSTHLPPGKSNMARVGHFTKAESGAWKLWQVTQLPDMQCSS